MDGKLVVDPYGSAGDMDEAAAYVREYLGNGANPQVSCSRPLDGGFQEDLAPLAGRCTRGFERPSDTNCDVARLVDRCRETPWTILSRPKGHTSSKLSSLRASYSHCTPLHGVCEFYVLGP